MSVLKDLKITLYDIFGFLLPGTLLLTAIAIMFWTIYAPQVAIGITKLSIEGWVVILLLAYFSGHIAQALGNLFVRPLQSSEDRLLSGKWPEVPTTVVEQVKSEIGSTMGIQQIDISATMLFRICDETVIQHGSADAREVFQYREGFYRGLMVSCMLLSLSLILRIYFSATTVLIAGAPHAISSSILVLLLAITLIATVLFFVRYRRFGRYRVTEAIFGFLVLRKLKPLKSEE